MVQVKNKNIKIWETTLCPLKTNLTEELISATQYYEYLIEEEYKTKREIKNIAQLIENQLIRFK